MMKHFHIVLSFSDIRSRSAAVSSQLKRFKGNTKNSFFSPLLTAALSIQSLSRERLEGCVCCLLLMAGADREEVSEVSEVVGCSN